MVELRQLHKTSFLHLTWTPTLALVSQCHHLIEPHWEALGNTLDNTLTPKRQYEVEPSSLSLSLPSKIVHQK